MYFYSGNLQKGDPAFAYTLFGWFYHDRSPQPTDWIIGKWVLLGIAILLLLAQIPLLRNEARLSRYNED